MYDRRDLMNFVEAMESSDDDEKARAFIRMNANDRSGYLNSLRACARSDAISLRQRATLFNVQRKLETVDRELRSAGR